MYAFYSIQYRRALSNHDSNGCLQRKHNRRENLLFTTITSLLLLMRGAGVKLKESNGVTYSYIKFVQAIGEREGEHDGLIEVHL